MLQKCNLHRAILRQSTTLSSEWLQAWHSVHGTYKSLEDQTLSWRLETSNLLHQCRVWQQSPTYHCSMHAPTSLCGCNLFVLCIQYMTCHMRLSAVFIAKIRTSGPIPSLPLILSQQQKIYMAQCQPLVQNSIIGTLNDHKWHISWVTGTSGSPKLELLRPSISVDAEANMKSFTKVPAACCHLRPPARTGSNHKK